MQMSDLKFLSVKRSECLRHHKKLVLNAEKKWNSAKVLEDVDDFGSSASHMIISIEEYIKSLIILLDGKGFSFRSIKGIGIFFKNHQIRFLIAYMMFVAKIFGDDVIQFMEKVKSDPDEWKKISSRLAKDSTYIAPAIRMYVLRKFVQLQKEFIWFSKLEYFRQIGFYSDFENLSEEVIEIDSEDFSKIKSRLTSVKDVIINLIETINSDDPKYIDQITELKSNCETNDFYHQVQIGLQKLHISKLTPFEILKREFEF
jgi:AbiV family abortive infection protein